MPHYAQSICSACVMHGADGILKGMDKGRYVTIFDNDMEPHRQFLVSVHCPRAHTVPRHPLRPAPSAH